MNAQQKFVSAVLMLWILAKYQSIVTGNFITFFCNQSSLVFELPIRTVANFDTSCGGFHRLTVLFKSISR
jgi:hypothetical protein